MLQYMLLGVLTVYLPYKLLGNISDLHELSLGLGVGWGLVPSYLPLYCNYYNKHMHMQDSSVKS